MSIPAPAEEEAAATSREKATTRTAATRVVMQVGERWPVAARMDDEVEKLDLVARVCHGVGILQAGPPLSSMDGDVIEWTRFPARARPARTG